jgi:acyl-CoA synthetase (AMP-forming)/AMP-acid ligase II
VAIADASGVRMVGESEWIETGDRAEIVEGGRFRLLGRRSEVFKRHGEKISLANLGTALREVWGGSLAFLLEKAPDGENGHVLVLSPAPSQDNLRQLLVTLRDRFRRPHWPIRIESVESMPLSPNGKPDLEALRARTRTILWKQIL